MATPSIRKLLWLGLIGLFGIILLACSLSSATPTAVINQSPAPDPATAVANNPQLGQGQHTPTALLNRSPTHTIDQTPAVTEFATHTALPTPYTYATAASAANLRAGPGTNFDIVGNVALDQNLPVYGRNQDGSWLSLSLTDTLWIWTDLVILPIDREAIPLATSIKPAQGDGFSLSPDIAATLQARSNQETSTARAQFRHNATATIRAYAEKPPAGTWCAQNVTRRICVNGFDYRRTVGTTTADAESRFIVMWVEVTNLSTHSIEVYPGYLLLGMIDGIHYPYANETYDLPEPFAWAELPANQTLQGSLVFLVRDEMAPVSVLYRDKLAEFEILINLKLAPDTIP